MTTMPSTLYGFMSPLHNIYTIATAYHTNWAILPGPLRTIPIGASNIIVLALETKTT
jgi:hypothetical protein